MRERQAMLETIMKPTKNPPTAETPEETQGADGTQGNVETQVAAETQVADGTQVAVETPEETEVHSKSPEEIMRMCFGNISGDDMEEEEESDSVIESNSFIGNFTFPQAESSMIHDISTEEQRIEVEVEQMETDETPDIEAVDEMETNEIAAEKTVEIEAVENGMNIVHTVNTEVARSKSAVTELTGEKEKLEKENVEDRETNGAGTEKTVEDIETNENSLRGLKYLKMVPM